MPETPKIRETLDKLYNYSDTLYWLKEQLGNIANALYHINKEEYKDALVYLNQFIEFRRKNIYRENNARSEYVIVCRPSISDIEIIKITNDKLVYAEKEQWYKCFSKIIEELIKEIRELRDRIEEDLQDDDC